MEKFKKKNYLVHQKNGLDVVKEMFLLTQLKLIIYHVDHILN